jgi:hypothetical protein
MQTSSYVTIYCPECSAAAEDMPVGCQKVPHAAHQRRSPSPVITALFDVRRVSRQLLARQDGHRVILVRCVDIR